MKRRAWIAARLARNAEQQIRHGVAGEGVVLKRKGAAAGIGEERVEQDSEIIHTELHGVGPLGERQVFNVVVVVIVASLR